MTDLVSSKDLGGLVAAGDPVVLAARIAKERAEDIVELFNRAKPGFVAKTLAALPESQAVEALDQPQLAHGAAILSSLPPERAARMLDLMSADQAAECVREMRISVRDELLAKVNPETKASLEKLLPYPEGVAGHIMTTEFVSVPADWTVRRALAHISATENTRETVYAVFVLDPKDGSLLRAAPLRRLIAADLDATVLEAAPDRAPLSVMPNTPSDETVRMISKYNLLAIPVVDENRHVVGIVTVDDAVDTLVRQQNAEVQKFGGMESLDAPYMQISFFDMIKKRAGWLCILFIAEMLTASAMQHFEEELQKAVVLALFIPLIMSSGGNSGSQATSLVIRAIALREVKLGEWWRVLMRELPSGITLGAILGLMGIIRIAAWQSFGIFDYGEHWQLIALTIGCALVGIVTFGSLVGSMLPFIVKTLGFDPATASAPFVATFVDVTGIVIYFTIAILILHGTVL
jgi:magnesium transporter